MDMLLVKSCNNAMFKRVLCLNFGRNPADFEGSYFNITLRTLVPSILRYILLL